MQKPLTELSIKELRDALASHTNSGVIFNYNDIVNELERRRARSHANRTFVLSLLAIIVSVISLAASILVALFK